MQKQILSLAIALPTILFTALPSLANPVQLVTTKVGNLQPVLGQPEFQAPAINNQDNQLRNPEDGQAPGNSPPKPGSGPGPRPPRTDTFVKNPRIGSQDKINSSPVNLNIENPVLGR